MEGNFLLPIIVIFPMAAALLVYAVGRKSETARDYAVNAAALIEFALALYVLVRYGLSDAVIKAAPEGSAEVSGYVVYFTIPQFCGMGLSFVLDGFRALYLVIASFMWLTASVISRSYFAHYRSRNRYYLFFLLTLGATAGVFLSADLYTTFIFFEIMSFSSYVWVAQDEKKESLRAADTYLAVAVIGGLVMLMGLFLLYDQLGTLQIGELHERYKEVTAEGTNLSAKNTIYIAGVCLLFGFGAKAGAFPLHIWLPKAHPVAPAPASALLSGILTKTGILGILIISCNLFLYDLKWGTLVLIVGVITMVTGAVLALFSINLKRTLACSSVSQIGFILVGIGMQGMLGLDNSLAIRGSLLHMVNHSLFKLVLFSAAGVVFMNIHKLDYNEIKGFGRKKPLLQFLFLMGSLGITGIPLWSGYISKTLLHESIVEYIEELHMGNMHGGLLGIGQMQAVEWIFLLCGGLTVAYMLKLIVVLFVERNNDEQIQSSFTALKRSYIGRPSAAILVIGASLFPLMGMFPGFFMDRIADFGEGFMHPEVIGERIAYFSLENLKGSIISIGIGLILYWLVVRKWMIRKEEKGSVYLDKWSPYWDLENSVYRPLLLRILPMIFGVLCRIMDSLVDGMVVVLRKTIYRDSKLPHELPEGTFYTHALGAFLDGVVGLMNRTVWRRNKRPQRYEHKLALKNEELSEDNTIIARSLSFGLLLFCTGLILTLFYLLLN